MKRNIVLYLLGAFSLLGAADIHYEKGDKAVQFAAKDLARCLTKVSGRTYQTKDSAAAAQVGDIVLVNDPKLEKQQWQFCDTRTFLSNCSQSAAGGFNSKGLLDRYRNPKISWRRI